MRNILAGAAAATLDLEVKLRVEVIHSEATKSKECGLLRASWHRGAFVGLDGLPMDISG